MGGGDTSSQKSAHPSNRGMGFAVQIQSKQKGPGHAGQNFFVKSG